MKRGEVGHDAGWHLRFYTAPSRLREQDELSIGAADYHAEIDATLPGGLAGGTYTFAIEGITNAHYQRLHAIWCAKPRRPLFVDLYLYWRDTGGVLGYLANVAGLTDLVDGANPPPADARVARLAVTRLARRVGARRYEAIIEARERAFEALRRPLGRPPRPGTDALEAARAVAAELDVDFEPHPLPGAPSSGATPKFEPKASKRGTSVLATLERAMTHAARKTGLGMYVIRDGTLHAGPGRAIPLAPPTQPLDPARGLVHVETTAPVGSDDGGGEAAADQLVHLTYSLVLKGRPDLRPGDVVSFADPFSDGNSNLVDPASALNATTTPSSFGDALRGLASSAFGGAGALVGGAATMYVTSVSHRLSRTEGFVTTLAGIGVQPGKEWDEVPSDQEVAPAPAPSATSHEELAGALDGLVRSHLPEPIRVGEVRATNPAGQSEPPSQTVDVWVGLTGDDGLPHRARRLAIDRKHKSRATGVPTVTPFAWGQCGLVLPRYPGTRVVLAHVNGSPDDAVDLGAVWESGHGPDARAGDWWLILPAAVDAAARQSADDATTPQEPTQAATNDLIDADGERTIEVGRLTVRVKPGKLAAPGQRPPPPADEAEQVTIEHANGSRIVIKDNGDIVIHSERELSLSAKHKLTLEADDVLVKVKNAMDVGDR